MSPPTTRTFLSLGALGEKHAAGFFATASLLHDAHLFRLERRHISAMLWPFARTGHTDVVIVRTWMLCGHSHTLVTRTIIVRTWMLWPLARTGHTAQASCGHGCSGHSHAHTGHTDVTIVRSSNHSHWPHKRSCGHGWSGQCLATRTHWSHRRYHRADMDSLAIRTHWSHGRYHRADMSSLAIRTRLSHGRHHRADMDALVTRAHWSRGRYHRADMDAVATRTHWSPGRYHRADMDALATRKHWSPGRYHRADMDALATRMHWSHGRYHSHARATRAKHDI